MRSNESFYKFVIEFMIGGLSGSDCDHRFRIIHFTTI
jgi:hypothetical protein